MSGEQSVLAAVAEALPLPPHRPLLVAVDGGDGAGKTTFALGLADFLGSQGRVVVQTSLDWFHFPRAHRHAMGRSSESVWSRHFDYRAARRELLEPWLSGPGSSYRTRWHDVVADVLVDDAGEAVPADGVLVVDGVFAQRPELRDLWDLVVYLDADEAVRVSRMARRDGGPDDPEHPDQLRYLQAQRHYREVCDPIRHADLVIDSNADFALAVGGAEEFSGWRLRGGALERRVRLPADAGELAAAVDRLVAGREVGPQPRVRRSNSSRNDS